MQTICCIQCVPAPRNGLLKPTAIKTSFLDICASMDTPTFHVIKLAADKTPSEWHSFKLSQLILHDKASRVAVYPNSSSWLY